MKNKISILLLCILFGCKDAICQTYTDSMYKDNRWYYCYQPKTDGVRNFYIVDTIRTIPPKQVTVKKAQYKPIICKKCKSDLFKKTDTACDKRKTVYVDGNDFGQNCDYVDGLTAVMFSTAWGCISTSVFKNAKILPNEELQFDGCIIYRNNAPIARVKHRGFYFGEHWMYIAFHSKTFFYKGIKTTFVN